MARPDARSTRSTIASAVPIAQSLRWSAGLLLAFVLLGGIAATLANSADMRATLSRLSLAQLAPLLAALLLMSSCAFLLRTLRWGGAVAASGNIYLTSLADGTVTVIKSGSTPELVAQNPPLGERVAATPAIADDTLYLRTAGHLYAFAEQ